MSKPVFSNFIFLEIITLLILVISTIKWIYYELDKERRRSQLAIIFILYFMATSLHAIGVLFHSLVIASSIWAGDPIDPLLR